MLRNRLFTKNRRITGNSKILRTWNAKFSEHCTARKASKYGVLSGP